MRGVAGLRNEHVELDRAPAIAGKMLAASRPRAASSAGFRYVTIGAAATVAAVALWPHPSSALALHDVKAAVQSQVARYERVYKPDNSGKLQLTYETWVAPGRGAVRDVGGIEIRQDGPVCYRFNPKINSQTIEQTEPEANEPVRVDDFAVFQAEFPILRTETDGTRSRYEFRMAPARQDLVVDTTTKLPIERDVYNPDGSVMEVHEYQFQVNPDLSVFKPDIKPNVPLYNIYEDRQSLQERLSGPPQVKVVEGIKVRLHAVVADAYGYVSAVISGGDPRSWSQGPIYPPQIVGLPRGMNATDPAYTAYANAKPGFPNMFEVNGERLRLDKVYMGSDDHGTPDYKWKQTIPDKFVLRIPVWRYDANTPLLDFTTKKKIGADTKLVGWAEFTVRNPLRTEMVEKLMPNQKIPASGLAASATTGSAKSTDKP